MTLEDDANKMAISKLLHNSSHPPEYHELVLDRLTRAMRGKSGEAAREALTRELGKLASYISRHPEVLKW